MAKQTFTAGQVLTAAQMTSLQANDYNWTTSAQTASYVLTAANAGQTVTMTSASATTITVNTGLFTAGDTVRILNLGAGTTTITAGTATVNTAGSFALPQYGSGTLWFSTASAAIFIPDDRRAGILQVVSTEKTDSFSTSSTTMVDVTGVSVSITPTFTSSKVLIVVSGAVANNNASNLSSLNLVRGSTAIAQGTGGISGNQSIVAYNNNAVNNSNFGLTYLDSPATTSATTYKLQARSNGGTAMIGRIGLNDEWRVVTTITAMEVAG